MNLNIIILIIFLLIYLIIKELVKYNKKENKSKIKYKFVTKPIYDKHLTDLNETNIILEDNIFNKMFSNPSPWMISRGIGILDNNDYRLKDK